MKQVSKDDTLAKLHEAELPLIQEVQNICKENNLRFFMMGGTFLGAVRHKGFIPWDDDADLGLPRPDYEKLIKILRKNTKYSLKTYRLDEDYNEYVPKLQNESVKIKFTALKNQKTIGAWIDIFPLDGMPNNIILRKIHQFRLLTIRALIKLSDFDNQVDQNRKHKNLPEKILFNIGSKTSLFKKLNTRKLLTKLDKNLKRYNYEKSKYVVNFMGAYKFKEMFPKVIYESVTNYKFETLQLPAPKDYDAVLKKLYGDYMTPPKKDEQNKHNTTIAKE